jgi:16S rRNA (cytidine1402-2'-O)-methyltransferase
MPGILYVVATPIGNLEDITLRALRVLKEVDLVACEDTRQTAKVLTHFQIEKLKVSYHEHNEAEKAETLLLELQKGKRIALVCDAGTPCISDPGYRIVRNALENGIPVVPIPGPCAFIAALSASGRSTESFIFLGFLPAKKSARRNALESLRSERRTLIFLESPKRLLDTLATVEEVFGERQVTVARELTKIYEEFFSGTSREAIVHFSKQMVKGEIILLIEKQVSPRGMTENLDPVEIRRKVKERSERLGMTKNDILKELSREYRIPKRDLYKLLLDSRNSR